MEYGVEGFVGITPHKAHQTTFLLCMRLEIPIHYPHSSKVFQCHSFLLSTSFSFRQFLILYPSVLIYLLYTTPSQKVEQRKVHDSVYIDLPKEVK